MSPRSHAALVALLLLLQDAAQGCSNVTSLSQQLDSLLAQYEREAAPARPARVHLALDLRHAAVRHDGSVHMLADLTMSWRDPRISWNASEWGCDTLLASADRLWLPEVSLLNGAGAEGQAALGVRLTSDGSVSWLLRYDATVPISLDIQDWPNDMQTVIFKFGSRTQTVDDLELDISDIMLTVVFEAGAWELVSMSGALSSVSSVSSVSSESARHVAAWTLQLRRRAAAHAAAAGAVLAAAVLMLLAAAAMPPKTRAPLCACASFTATVWLVSALVRVPGAPSTPRSVRALGAVCACAGAATLAAAVVTRAAARSRPPPRPLVALASALSRWCKLVPDEETCSSAERGAWIALAQLLDYTLTAALLITLFVSVCIYV